MAKSSNFGGILITLLVLGGIGYGGYYFYAKRTVKDPEYSTVKAENRQVIQSITASGNLQTMRTVDLGAQVSGLILEVNVDFNDEVKKDQVLVRIDPTTYQQKLLQVEADMKSTLASYASTVRDTKNAEILHTQGLMSEIDYENAMSKMIQAESTKLSREAALFDAKTNLERTIVRAPTDAIVLNRATDPGRTVNATNSAPNLLTLVSSLDTLQIDAGVSEADIGSVSEGQPVSFTVDAYPGQQFSASVKQVRNSAKNTSGVVTYSAIIDVDNTARKLRPGMTANVSIIIASRPTSTLTVPNSTLRVRIPPEIESQVTKAGAPAASANAPKPLTPEEKTALESQVLADSGLTGGGVITPDQLQKARQAAKDKGLTDMTFIDNAGRGGRGAGGVAQAGGRGAGGRGAGGGGGGGRGGARGAPNVNQGAGMNVSTTPRVIYRLVTDANGKKHPESLPIILGISDGQFTEVLSSEGNLLQAGDTLISYIAMPGAAAAVKLTPQQQGNQNPFGATGAGGARGGGAGGGGGGGRGGF